MKVLESRAKNDTVFPSIARHDTFSDGPPTCRKYGTTVMSFKEIVTNSGRSSNDTKRYSTLAEIDGGIKKKKKVKEIVNWVTLARSCIPLRCHRFDSPFFEVTEPYFFN